MKQETKKCPKCGVAMISATDSPDRDAKPNHYRCPKCLKKYPMKEELDYSKASDQLVKQILGEDTEISNLVPQPTPVSEVIVGPEFNVRIRQDEKSSDKLVDISITHNGYQYSTISLNRVEMVVLIEKINEYLRTGKELK